MLKPTLTNKRLSDGESTAAMNIGGVDVSREALHQTREKLLEDLARERDPQKVEELALNVARVNSAINAFKMIDEAKAQAAPIRERIRQEDLAAAREGQMIFEGRISQLVWPALERFGVKRCHGDSTQMMRYQLVYQDYFNQLFEQLTYSAAEKQIAELQAAEKESREWRDLVNLPQPNNTDIGDGTRIRLVAQRSSFGNRVRDLFR